MVMNYKEPAANILLVENDEILMIGLQSYLEKANFHIQVARDGFEALERILAFKPQLAVIDIMTLRMDGYDFIRALRQDIATTFIPVIILSTKESVEDKLLGFTLGIDDYLDKPFKPEELVNCIRAVLRRVYG
jgi:DNA-binding response OmpR family regulator